MVVRCTGEGWGFYGRFNSGLGSFLIGLAFQGLSQVNWWLAPLLGEGNNREHFAHQPCGRPVSLL
jgi:hypothetical protein